MQFTPAERDALIKFADGLMADASENYLPDEDRAWMADACYRGIAFAFGGGVQGSDEYSSVRQAAHDLAGLILDSEMMDEDTAELNGWNSEEWSNLIDAQAKLNMRRLAIDDHFLHRLYVIALSLDNGPQKDALLALYDEAARPGDPPGASGTGGRGD